MFHTKYANAYRSGLSGVLSVLGCCGLLSVMTFSLSGCAGAGGPAGQEKQAEPVRMKVTQLDQLRKLGDKTADGQFVVARLAIKNLSRQTIVLNPTDFTLENITDKDEERYSQPAEKMIEAQFVRTYGEEEKGKVMDFMPVNLYPRLELARYFVFMLPSEAKPEEYRITYTSAQPQAKVSVPLVNVGTTIINDHRSIGPTSSSNP